LLFVWRQLACFEPLFIFIYYFISVLSAFAQVFYVNGYC
jgi:hypothetical protein